jgi:hypothetical protein
MSGLRAAGGGASGGALKRLTGERYRKILSTSRCSTGPQLTIS